MLSAEAEGQHVFGQKSSCNVYTESNDAGDTSVKGHLKGEVKASRWVQSVMEQDYALPFVQKPPPAKLKHHRSSLGSKQFVNGKIMNLP